MEKKKIFNLFKRVIFIALIVIFITVGLTIMLKYEVEGEKSLPYEIDKILMVSTVDGDFTEDEQYIWNINVTEINDLYIYIDSKEETDETIKQITIENFNLVRAPQKGNVKIYRPTADLDNLYTYSEQDYLNDKIVYTGGKIDDMKSLEIANNGGILGFRLALEDLGRYLSNEDEEIIYDGRLLQNLGVSLEEIKLQLSFDIIIETNSNIKYKGSLSMEMPTDEIIEKGSSKIELTDFSNVIFKRI
ncbi:MAG: hypothetical protein J6A36_04845 [Clostridia bacterium]|nr:hypothetical protein [Clostridia bacterium]